MFIYNDLKSLEKCFDGVLLYENGVCTIIDEKKIRDDVIDDLIYTAVFSQDDVVKKYAQAVIFAIADILGACPSSIYDLYSAIGRGEVQQKFSVPAINIRTMTYDMSKIIHSTMIKKNVGPVVFEIARSEMGYTIQQPAEYACSILAGALKAGYQGPVFLQGDHYQFDRERFVNNSDEEISLLKKLIDESLAAKFYNIDIDASTLVDLEKSDLDMQQKNNYEMTALLTQYIRSHEPSGVTVSIGGEIGHIGGINSTVDDFNAYMNGYTSLLSRDISGISKVSVQTGTSHGGLILKDGTLADVNIDFSVLSKISTIARTDYKIAGTVQHGASTLPDDFFHHFPENDAVEVHLATGIQNIVFDMMPERVRSQMYEWISKDKQTKPIEEITKEQFIYKTRKRALGQFKKELWTLSDLDKKKIMDVITNKFSFLCDQLHVTDTRHILNKYY